MKVIFPARVLAALAASFLVNQFATAQATTNQLFGPIFTRSSPSGATGETPAAFGTTTVSLTCPSGSTANIMGLASEGNPSANLLVDNNIFVTVSQGSYTNGPQNVCPAADGFS